MMTLGLGYGFYRAANAHPTQLRQEARLAETLLRAKEALLARAITDLNRPGSLPCPDIATNSREMNNFPGDGKADMFAGNHCPAYVGWLPWITLDLPELSDDTGNHLWYTFSPSLRDDDSAQPINGATPMLLEVDGHTDIAAIIIAPGTAIGRQQHPSNAPADYLEGGNGLSNAYVSGPQGPDFNDRVITISRSELMAAVGKRLAGEVRHCLEQHADTSSNIDHRYPWPAPLADADRRGKAGTRFGRLALSQPGSGPEAALKANIENLEILEQQLAVSQDAARQLQLLAKLGDTAMQARNLFQSIFAANSQLKRATDDAASRLQAMATSIDAATANGRISRSEGTDIRSLGENVDAMLDSLPQLLGELGLDALPWVLAQHRTALTDAQTTPALLGQIQAMRDLLSMTHTPRPDLAPLLVATSTATTNTYDAVTASAAAPANTSLRDTASSAVSRLLGSALSFEQAIAASRVNVLAGEIADFPEVLEELVSGLNESNLQTNRETLLNGLIAARNTLSRITTGPGSIAASRNESITALSTAISAAQSPLSGTEPMTNGTMQAAALIRTLQAGIAANEASDNNLTRTSLLEAIGAYRRAGMQFTAMDTATQRPLQSDILQPAEALGEAAARINTWLRIISDNSLVSAQAARAVPAATDQALASIATLDDSGYATAVETLAATRDNTVAIQASIDRPGAETQRRASNALITSIHLTQELINRARHLATSLNGTTASAFPTVWHSGRCDFLRPEEHSWWNDNRWSETLFYQVGNPLKVAPGVLTVNASGRYRLVVLSSGPLLPWQSRTIQTVANYFEGSNANPSRDGNAFMPDKNFSGAATSPGFNDRLAY